MHHVTKLVKVGSLSAGDRAARGLTEMPDDMEIPIVVEQIVADTPAQPDNPLVVPRGFSRQPLPVTAEAEKAEPEKEKADQVRSIRSRTVDPV